VRDVAATPAPDHHLIAADLQSVGKTLKADAPVLLAIDEA
jgi:hypothetical protein